MIPEPERTQLLSTLSKLIGEPLSRIDLHLGAARANNPPVDSNPHIQEAHAILGMVSTSAKAMESIIMYGAQVAPANPGLRPGETVGDVVSSDTAEYRGPVDAQRLTEANRRYIANNVGKFSNSWGQWFNAKPTFPSTGGDAMVGEQDPMTPDGFDLAKPNP